MARSKNDTGRQPVSPASDSVGPREEQQPPRPLTPKPANSAADGHGENAVFLTEKQLAARHQKSVKTIRNLRVKGGYIPYVKIGRHVVIGWTTFSPTKSRIRNDPRRTQGATMLDRAASNALLSLLQKRDASRFYGNGEPSWAEGKQKKPAQISKQARAERTKLIKVLRRHGKDNNDQALQLADLLSSCCKIHRCLSGACPVCSRAAQRLLVVIGASVIERGGKHWHVASVVWREHRYAEGKLNADLMFEKSQGTPARGISRRRAFVWASAAST